MTLYWQFEVGLAKVAKWLIGTGLALDWRIGTELTDWHRIGMDWHGLARIGMDWQGLANWRICVGTKNWPPIGTGLAWIDMD